MADFKYDSTHNADAGKQPGDPIGFNSKMGWGNVFERSYATPLDRTSLFITKADALAYAKGGSDTRGLSGTSYPGQIITVLESGQPKVYVIVGGTIDSGSKEEDKSTRTLAELGQQSSSGADIFWLNSDGSQV